jgi:hypothetical protein
MLTSVDDAVVVVVIVVVCLYAVFDCCKQSLSRLTHPPTHSASFLDETV